LASLFEPMRFAQLPNVPKGQDRDFAKARAAARWEVQEQRAEIERVAGKKALENLEMDVETDADGNPAFIMMTAGVVKRTFGGAQASPGRSDEVAYVSPAGVEYGNSDPRKPSTHAILAEKSRELFGKLLPSRPIRFRRVPRLGTGSRQPDGNRVCSVCAQRRLRSAGVQAHK
jgi:hypothetical protein